MRTSKPISAISYNTKAYLELVLARWVEARKIEYWQYIEHKAEDMTNPITGEIEREKKDHIHLHVIPNKLIDTQKLRQDLQEQDPTHPLKPLGCTIFQPSKTSDWTLYALHDEAYLASKLKVRHYHYSPEEIVASNDTIKEEIVFSAYHESSFSDTKALLESIKKDKISKLLESGFISPANAQRVAAYINLAVIAKKEAARMTEANNKAI